MDRISYSSNYVEVSKSPFIALNAEIIFNHEDGDVLYRLLNKMRRIEVFLTKPATLTISVNHFFFNLKKKYF
jgi:hypothetical protein